MILCMTATMDGNDESPTKRPRRAVRECIFCAVNNAVLLRCPGVRHIDALFAATKSRSPEENVGSNTSVDSLSQSQLLHWSTKMHLRS
eukprot:m.552383 g.552383  ORF g.552383 m.552383 type:complete len:88 (-) comp22165_c0_seq100:484-747(-)